ncbi:hypothetical protein [Riemerella anatipestifer]|uniref:hypothetical protein n=1 Tax=Riemerella anatipestifer TaxID=34085 RepID=UPI002A8C00CE|nr:hypothetical protein [Riemerella anatipestifer]
MKQCKICGEEKPLIQKSHIISKCLFKDLFEEKPRKHILEFDIINRTKPKKPSDTLYDKDLFCKECDGNNGMGDFEDYYTKYLRKNNFRIEKRTGIDWHIYTEYNFDKLFLFFNLQIFRASLSNREDFKDVNFDEQTIEKIRTNIKHKKVQSQTNEIAIVKLTDESNFKDIIGSFRKIDGNYLIILRNFIVFYFFNSKAYLYSKLKGHILKRDETIIPVIPKSFEIEFIKSIIGIK